MNPNGSQRLAAALAAYVVELDATGTATLVYATDRARAIGIDPERVKDVLDVVLAADRERVRAARRDLVAVDGLVTTVMLEGGVPVRLEERVVARCADGNVAEIAGVVGEANESAVESLRFLTDLLNTLPDPVFVKDRQHRFIAFNEAFSRFVGLGRAALLNTTDADHFLPEQVAIFWEHDDRVLENDIVDENEEEFTDSAGLTHVVSTRKASFDDPSGQRVLVGVIHDVTERRRLERKLITAARAQTDFVANISHELRTPLNGILGMAQLLARRQLGAVEHEYLDVIAASGQALLALVDDVLDFSKIEAGRLEIEQQPFRPDDVVEDACAVFAAAATKRGVELVVRLAPDLPARVNGDRARLRQIVINLVGNAVKFTERGEVVIDAAVAGGKLVVSVRDTGVGLDEDTKARLFLPFTQADASITRRFGGTGLGLAISQRLAHLMGGAIRADGAPGAGSVFTLEVPAAVVDPAERPYEATAGNGRAPPVKHARVDLRNPTARAHLETELVRLGVSVGAVGAGDVVFVDDGAAVREAPGAVVVGVGIAPNEDGGMRHLVKPVRRSRLEALLHTLDGARPERAPAPLVGRGLVVDDSPVNAKVLVLMLEHAGLSAAVAKSGYEALALLEQEPFDVVLMDCQMPDLDGIETARRIRGGKHRTLPIVAVTADASWESIEACLDAGMQAVLKKPVRVEELVDVLQRYVSTRADSPDRA